MLTAEFGPEVAENHAQRHFRATVFALVPRSPLGTGVLMRLESPGGRPPLRQRRAGGEGRSKRKNEQSAFHDGVDNLERVNPV